MILRFKLFNMFFFELYLKHEGSSINLEGGGELDQLQGELQTLADLP